MRADFTLYTPEYISGVMSLRKPKKKSLEFAGCPWCGQGSLPDLHRF